MRTFAPMAKHGPGKDPSVLAKEILALELYLQGETYGEIAYSLGVSRSYARDLVINGLEVSYVLPSAAVREREKKRIEALMKPYWGPAFKGIVYATEMILKLMNRYHKIIGVDAPIKIDVMDMVRRMAIEKGLDPAQAVNEAEALARQYELESHAN